jgi:uncharacterized protein (UPF0147 family)
MAKSRTRPLTPAQRLFADYVIEGKGKSEAYKLAYPNGTPNRLTVAKEAHTVSNLPHVAEYIAEALTERRREVLLTRDAKRQILGSIARDPKAPRQARIMAVKTDNEMTGDNAPMRVEGEITLHTIFRALTQSKGLPAPHEALEVEASPVAEAEMVDDLTPDLERTA